MGKDEEERQKHQHARDCIDKYVSKQGEEQVYHKQEGGDTNYNNQQVGLTIKTLTSLKYYLADHLRRGAGPRLHHLK